MKIFVSNVLVFFGALLLIASYYYVYGLWKRYLRYYERNIEKYEGWQKDFLELRYAMESYGQWTGPVVCSLFSYLLIGFGIIASVNLFESGTDASLYTSIIALAFIIYTLILLMFEKNREARRPIRLIRMLSINTLVAFSLILGAALRKDGLLVILMNAVVFYIVVNLGLVLPVFNRFWKSDKE